MFLLKILIIFMVPYNIRAGFQACGIFPLSVEKVLSRLPPEDGLREEVQNEFCRQLTEQLMFAATGILQRNRSEPRRPIASLLDLPTLSVQSQQMRRKQTRCQAQVGIRPVPEEPKAEAQLLVEEPLHEEGEDGEEEGELYATRCSRVMRRMRVMQSLMLRKSSRQTTLVRTWTRTTAATAVLVLVLKMKMRRLLKSSWLMTQPLLKRASVGHPLMAERRQGTVPVPVPVPVPVRGLVVPVDTTRTSTKWGSLLLQSMRGGGWWPGWMLTSLGPATHTST